MLSDFWDTLIQSRRLYDRMLMPLCEAHNINRMELDILLFLANNPKMDTASDIIRCRNFTKSHVSASVKHLVELGLLEQSYQAGNRKNIHLALCQAAGPVVSKGQGFQRQFLKLAFQGFTAQELAEMGSRMERIKQNIAAQEGAE